MGESLIQSVREIERNAQKARNALDRVILDSIDIASLQGLGDESKTPETLDIRDTQSRVRVPVRDELDKIIVDVVCGGNPKFLFITTREKLVDRILDRLVDATYGTPACGHLSAIRAGAR